MVVVVKKGCCVVGASYQAVAKNISRKEVTRGSDDGQETRCLVVCKSKMK